MEIQNHQSISSSYHMYLEYSISVIFLEDIIDHMAFHEVKLVIGNILSNSIMNKLLSYDNFHHNYSGISV
jgi:hypothetical protein